MRSCHRFFVLCAAWLPVAACSGNATETTVTPPTPEQAANAVANAYCTRLDACSHIFVELVWGDVPTCTSRLEAEFASGLAASGTTWTPDRMQACAQAIPAASCDQILGRNLPAACIPSAGTLANGAACGSDAQCSGGHCQVDAAEVCGVCSTFAAAGAACVVSADCERGLVCVGTTTRTCAAYVTAGGSCDATHQCLPTLACVNGTCGAPASAGAACLAASDNCDRLAGVFCNPLTQACQQVDVASAGQPCGLVSSTLTLCAEGSFDFTAACHGMAAPTYTGTCLAAAADGATCSDTTGPVCLNPSVCMNGACRLNAPASCP
jgi:hypothetical protein